MNKIIKSPLRYPGGKSKTAKHIVKRLPDFKEYREPFTGGASVFLNMKQKFPDKEYWINDLYPELYMFWMMCKKELPGLVRQIKIWREKYKDGKELYNFLLENRTKFNHLETAAFFFILNRITFSGTTESGGYSDQAFRLRFTPSCINRLEKLEGLFRGVSITNLDYKEVVNKEGDDVLIFLDPPYFSPVTGLYGRKGNMHIGFDHSEMASVLKESKHKWLITYDDCEEIRNLYPESEKVHIFAWDLNYSMKNWTKMSGNELKHKEIIITNFELNN